jgi:hypothetical protein
MHINGNMLSFLDLPAELRLRIYYHTINPDTTPLTDINGL